MHDITSSHTRYQKNVHFASFWVINVNKCLIDEFLGFVFELMIAELLNFSQALKR